MEQIINRLKFKIPKKFMQMLNNIISNNFNTFNKPQYNVIKIDDCFWNLNINLKKYCILLIHGNHIFAESCEFIDYKNSMEDVQYNNM